MTLGFLRLKHTRILLWGSEMIMQGERSAPSWHAGRTQKTAVISWLGPWSFFPVSTHRAAFLINCCRGSKVHREFWITPLLMDIWIIPLFRYYKQSYDPHKSCHSLSTHYMLYTEAITLTHALSQHAHCSFPMATITNYGKFSGLKQHNILQFWILEV